VKLICAIATIATASPTASRFTATTAAPALTQSSARRATSIRVGLWSARNAAPAGILRPRTRGTRVDLRLARSLGRQHHEMQLNLLTDEQGVDEADEDRGGRANQRQFCANQSRFRGRQEPACGHIRRSARQCSARP
jgi:hypothetical protein